MVTGIAWKLSSDAVKKRSEERFLFQASELSQAINARIRVYEQVLWGGVGLFRASNQVDRPEWKAYVEALKLNEHWPGIQGLGWSIPIRPQDKEQFEASIRAQGFSNFQISPTGSRDFYTSIIYLEPFDWRNQRAFGYDMWSNDTRRQAMQRAAETGKASTSGLITLVQETDENVQRGFLTYVPVYRNPTKSSATMEGLKGWVYAAFRMGDLMKGIRGGIGDVQFKIYDGTQNIDSKLLFSSPGQHSSKRHFHREILNLQGRNWLIEFSADPRAPEVGENNLPTLVATLGLIIDCLLFYLITTLVLMNKRAEGLAKRMTVDLRESNEKLNRSNQELERFTTLASHDLQEPLRGITSFSQLLASEYGDSLDSDGKLYLESLVQSTQRMRDLIKDLRDYTEFSKMELTRSPVNTALLVSDVIVELSSTAQQHEVDIEVGSLPTALAGESLRTVFYHLILNAIIYRDCGGRIKISGTEDQGFCSFQVLDDGLGLDPKHQTRIFELFARLHRWEEIPGTGLGLALCRRIINIYGGDIWHEPASPKGSKFCFTLPAVPAPK